MLNYLPLSPLALGLVVCCFSVGSIEESDGVNGPPREPSAAGVNRKDVASGLETLGLCPTWDVMAGYSPGLDGREARAKFALVVAAMRRLCRYNTPTLREVVRVVQARTRSGSQERKEFLRLHGVAPDSPSDPRAGPLEGQINNDMDKVIWLDRFAFECPTWEAGGPALPSAPKDEEGRVNVLWPLSLDTKTGQFKLVAIPYFGGGRLPPLIEFDDFSKRYRRRARSQIPVGRLPRLPQHESGSSFATYTYSGDGLKRLERVDGAATTLVWDGSDYLQGRS